MAIIDVDFNYRLHPQLKPTGFVSEESSQAFNADAHLALMDEAGVQMTGVVANVAAVNLNGQRPVKVLDDVTADMVHAEVAKHPDRYFGWVGVHPFGGTQTIRYIDYAINTLGFKGVHVYPHWFGINVNDRVYYPIYSKCAELGVPIAMQFGLGGHRGNRRSVGSPWWVDDILYDFPELNLMSVHIGQPFEVEFVRLCDNYANFYLIADMPPRMWADVVVKRLQSPAGTIDLSERVLWGTNGSAGRSPKGSLEEFRKLGSPQAAAERVLGGNAERLLKLGAAVSKKEVERVPVAR